MVLYDRGLGYNEIVGGAFKTYASHREPLSNYLQFKLVPGKKTVNKKKDF